MEKIFVLFALGNLLILENANAQSNIGIGTTTPNASAALDVTAPNKGVLIPRLSLTSSSDASTVPSPATYLIVMNTNASLPDGKGLYVNMGTPSLPNWVKSGVGSPTSNAWSLTGNAGTVDATNFIGTIDNLPLNIRVNNQKAGRIDSALLNTFWGYRAGSLNTTGNGNTANGFAALDSNTIGIGNTANGLYALNSNISGNFNSALGLQALSKNTMGLQNVAVGTFSLYSNTTGSNNIANGYQALQNNTTGYSNVAIGVGTLFTNTTKSNLVAIGDSALYNNGLGAGNQQAFNNIAIGSKALYSNTTGFYNTAVGTSALKSNTIGLSNTATGYETIRGNTTGVDNTGFGSSALGRNTEGYGNTGLGSTALYGNVTGNWNTACGYEADVNQTYLNNTTTLGARALVYNSNQVQIGDENVTAVFFGNPYVTPIYAGSYNTMSDKRFKYKIEDDVPGIEFIKKLKPVTYYLDEEQLNEFRKTGIINKRNVHDSPGNYNKKLHSGFLAQDVEKIAKELGYNFDAVSVPKNDIEFYSINYSQFVMPLVKAVQEQQVLIDDQNKKITDQAAQIKKLDENYSYQIKVMNEKIEALTKTTQSLSHK